MAHADTYASVHTTKRIAVSDFKSGVHLCAFENYSGWDPSYSYSFPGEKLVQYGEEGAGQRVLVC